MSQPPATIGRYEVERLLGEGGMGVLYLARDPVLDRHVALKLLRVNGEDLRRRFMREAQSAGRLQHPNIVTVYDVGDHQGELYIAMEYIDGDTLATLIRDDLPFSPIRKLDIIDEVADGLGFAHQRGIIHRDIKPANLMISRAGLVKVLDFGIARVSHRDSAEIDAHTLIGTPAYMAPEQLEGADIDARSDIYAVGLVMYELFSGRRAFAGATTADVLQQVLGAQVTPVERLLPDIDPELARVIARAMARQPADRYPDLQAMRKDLARARRRVMQASGDDATVVVSASAAAAGWVVAPPAAAAATDKPPATATATAPVSAPDSDTVYAPVVALPSTAPVTAPPPPPLPGPRSAPAAAGRPRLPDSGPMPVPLPSVPSGGAIAPAGAGRSTVDAPVLAAARGQVAPATAAAGSAARPPVSAAAPPVAAPGHLHTAAALGAPVPAARRGVSAALVVGGLLAMLAVSFVVAFMAARSFGLLGGEPAPAQSATGTPAPTLPVAASVPDAPAAVPPARPGSPAEAPDSLAAGSREGRMAGPELQAAPTIVAPPAQTPGGVKAAPPGQSTPAAPAAARPLRQSRPVPAAAAAAVPTAVVTAPPVPPPAEPAAPLRSPAIAEAALPPRPPERREPDPPPVAAPQVEGLALVRAYVAARNTAHASGIRRVWPGVDDNHLRRVTTAFSAPLSLADCQVEPRDGARAIATCRLTQPGSTDGYAPGQSLTIRRTFVFDLVRGGGGWVIAGLRE